MLLVFVAKSPIEAPLQFFSAVDRLFGMPEGAVAFPRGVMREEFVPVRRQTFLHALLPTQQLAQM